LFFWAKLGNSYFKNILQTGIKLLIYLLFIDPEIFALQHSFKTSFKRINAVTRFKQKEHPLTPKHKKTLKYRC